MGTTTQVDGDQSTEQTRVDKRFAAWSAVEHWFSGLEVLFNKTQPRPRLFYASIAVILVLSAGVRLLYWQDGAPDLSLHDRLSQNMALQYRREARRMLEEGRLLFPLNHPETGDARMIIHPPGYSIVMALSFKLFGENDTPLRALQLAADAASAVLVFLIAAELLPFAVALLAGLLMALSPHASYYAIKLSPDSLAVLPILMAVYLVIKASTNKQLRYTAAAGALFGVSCWFRANALLLAPMFVLIAPVLFERGKRIRYSALLLAASVIIISPITIRNWVVYRHFLPVALPSGINLVQGIAELDTERRFGMPLGDRDVLEKDVEWNNQPEYGGNLWTPDGVERDRTRFNRGLDVLRSHPLWYAGAMLRRAQFMVSFNESRRRGWPFDTATVPPVSATPPFGRSILPIDEMGASDRVISPSVLFNGGTSLSERAEVSLVNGGDTLQIIGAGGDFDDQFTSTPISVRRNTNYQINLRAMVRKGLGAVRVIGQDKRIVLASAILPLERAIREMESGKHPVIDDGDLSHIAFASGDTDEVNLVFSNNGATPERSVIEITKVELFERGATPTLWTRVPRIIIRGIERNIYKTERLLPLIVAGLFLLGIARRGRTLLILAVVPAYYLVSHSPFSTEYRYVLAIHCFLFIFGAVSLYGAGLGIAKATRHLRGAHWFPRRVTDPG
jgi:dolichyl-phosphate-mannose-protein mannosyltransferase